MRCKVLWLVTVLTFLVAGCTNGIGLFLPTPIPTSIVALSRTALKYVLSQKFGPVSGNKTSSASIFYCDPDEYPVSRGIEKDLALERFANIQSDTEEFPILLQHLGLTNVTQFSNEQKLLIYQESKRLNAIPLKAAGDVFSFEIAVRFEQNEFFVEGTIDKYGMINVLKKRPFPLVCPVCLARNTLIDTPVGQVAVQDLREGMIVWTLNSHGDRVPDTVMQTTRNLVSKGTQVIHLVLDDGRQLIVSSRHPLADRRTVGTLFVGDNVDGAKLVVLESVPLDGDATYDILPSGDTGLYWANGILVGSTLHSSTGK